MSEQDICTLFAILLKIAQQPGPSDAYNAKKTRSMAIWALSQAQVSATMLEGNKVILWAVISDTLKDPDSDEISTGDSLKVCLPSVICTAEIDHELSIAPPYSTSGAP